MCFLKWLDVKLINAAKIVAACVVLHNICGMYGDQYFVLGVN